MEKWDYIYYPVQGDRRLMHRETGDSLSPSLPWRRSGRLRARQPSGVIFLSFIFISRFKKRDSSRSLRKIGAMY